MYIRGTTSSFTCHGGKNLSTCSALISMDVIEFWSDMFNQAERAGLKSFGDLSGCFIVVAHRQQSQFINIVTKKLKT